MLLGNVHHVRVASTVHVASLVWLVVTAGEDVERNEPILSAILSKNPCRVPSGFYLADALILVDKKFQGFLYFGKDVSKASCPF